jgi:hypothetical protein
MGVDDSAATATLKLLFGMKCACSGAMNPKHLQTLRARRIPHRHHAAVAKSTQVLRGEERETAVVPQRSGTPPPVLRPNRLRRIFDHHQSPTRRYLQNRIHVRHLAK